jgi:hypothetical protein
VDKTPATTQPNVHDETLIDWFLSLDPSQRLAELESRLALFASAADAHVPDCGPCAQHADGRVEEATE